MQTETYPPVLAQAMRAGITNPPEQSPLHGGDHWKGVALMGFWLAKMSLLPNTDWEFIFTFACLHDTMREDDDDDPLHGSRASQLFVRMCDDPGIEGFPPFSQRAQDMCYALSHHVGGEHARDHENMSVGLCWDADRLLLWRVGLIPDPRYLTTPFACLRATQMLGAELSRKHGDDLPSWTTIREEMEQWRT